MNTELLPSDILNSPSPSNLDGVPKEVEFEHRLLGCELIQEVGITMKLPQVVMVTGQNILHRFYYRKSLQKFDVFIVSMACFVIASKVEETPKLLRDVLLAFHSTYLKRKQLRERELDVGGHQYSIWKDELILTERYVLKDLGFCLYGASSQPQKFLLYFVKLLNGDSNVAQIAWNYLNDSCRLDIALRYSPDLIACAAVYMAFRKEETPLPDLEPAWWTVITNDFRPITEVCNCILSLYQLPKVQWLEPLNNPFYLTKDVCKDDFSLGDGSGKEQQVGFTGEKPRNWRERALKYNSNYQESLQSSTDIISIKKQFKERPRSRSRSRGKEYQRHLLSMGSREKSYRSSRSRSRSERKQSSRRERDRSNSRDGFKRRYRAQYTKRDGAHICDSTEKELCIRFDISLIEPTSRSAQRYIAAGVNGMRAQVNWQSYRNIAETCDVFSNAFNVMNTTIAGESTQPYTVQNLTFYLLTSNPNQPNSAWPFKKIFAFFTQGIKPPTPRTNPPIATAFAGEDYDGFVGMTTAPG